MPKTSLPNDDSARYLVPGELVKLNQDYRLFNDRDLLKMPVGHQREFPEGTRATYMGPPDLILPEDRNASDRFWSATRWTALSINGERYSGWCSVVRLCPLEQLAFAAEEQQ